MKKYLSLTIAMMMMIGGVLAVTAQAQVFGSQRVHARIPFTFNVGNTRLPAGEYTVTVLNPTSDRKVLQIRSTDGRLSAIIQTTGVNTDVADNAKLVFNRYGHRYFFAQAQLAGDSTMLAAVKSGAERVEEQAVASMGQKVAIAIIAG